MKKQNETNKPATFNLATIKGIKAAFAAMATILQAVGYTSKDSARSDAWDGKRVDATDCSNAAAALAEMVTDTENGPRVLATVEGKADRYPGALFVSGSATTGNRAGLGYKGVVASVGKGPAKVKGQPTVGNATHLKAGINHLVRTAGDMVLPSGALVAHCQQSPARFVVLTPEDGGKLTDTIARAASKLTDDSDKDTRGGLLALGVQIAADCEAFTRSRGKYYPAG